MKKTNENALKRAILKYFEVEGICAWRNQSGMTFGSHKGVPWAIKMGIPGVADIVALLPQGRTWLIECKLPGEKQSPDQLWFESACVALGHFYSVVDSLDQIIREIEGLKFHTGFRWRCCPPPPVRIKKPKPRKARPTLASVDADGLTLNWEPGKGTRIVRKGKKAKR
jgi:hypothetical protein